MAGSTVRPFLAAALAAAAFALPPPAAPAQDAADPARKLQRARELLRTGKSADRKAAVGLLIEIDTGPAIAALEDAILRSAQEMERRQKEWDALDLELVSAEIRMEDSAGYSWYPDARSAYLEVKARYDALAAEMRGHLEICVEGRRSFSAFQSPAAIDRIAKGAANANNPLARQMYIQALGAPGRADRVPVLLDLLKAGESRVRAAAVRALRSFPTRRATLDAVVPLLRDRCWAVRVGAAEVVARAPVDVAVPILIEALGRENGEPALQIDSLLCSLTGARPGGDAARWKAWLEQHEGVLRDGRFEPAEEPGTTVQPGASEAAFFEIPVESRNLILVLDLSRSMRAEMKDIDARTAALLAEHGYAKSRLAVSLVQAYRLVGGLPKGARLNILAFSDGVTRFTSKSAQVNESSKKNALDWLNNQYTGWCTNIWDALRQAFGDHMSAGGSTRFEDLPDTIIFLTDGVPTAGRFRDERSLADLVELWNASAGVVVHCVGIGPSYAGDLMKSLSAGTGGYFFDAQSKRLLNERVRPRVPAEARRPPSAKLLADAQETVVYGGAINRRDAVAAVAEACDWSEEGLAVLAAVLTDPDADVRVAAVAALASLGPRGVPALAKEAGRSDGRCRLDAVRALAGLGPAAADAVPALEALAAGGDAALAAEAAKALERIRAAKRK
ncbi:MAG TPA: HEAT repeat domain-containing protein [Planctomycetota bacterium]|nr:HEAT repeat domain-containing protein [Planctomycetota bacterium]